MARSSSGPGHWILIPKIRGSTPLRAAKLIMLTRGWAFLVWQGGDKRESNGRELAQCPGLKGRLPSGLPTQNSHPQMTVFDIEGTKWGLDG